MTSLTSNAFQSNPTAGAGAAAPKSGTQQKVYRSKTTGRIISEKARIAAARARVTADKKRGVSTAKWILDIAQKDSDRF